MHLAELLTELLLQPPAWREAQGPGDQKRRAVPELEQAQILLHQERRGGERVRLWAPGLPGHPVVQLRSVLLEDGRVTAR